MLFRPRLLLPTLVLLDCMLASATTFAVLKKTTSTSLKSSSTTAKSTGTKETATSTSTKSTVTNGAMRNVPPNALSVQNLGLTSDDKFNAAIYRDGGGGGFINGQHVLSFADSFTAKPPGTENSSFSSFVHNTFAYIGYRNASDPTDLFDFGSKPDDNGDRIFISTPVAAFGNETNLPHTTVSIWPNGNMIPLVGSDTRALAVYTVFNSSSLTAFYNTMVSINIVHPTNAVVAPGSNVAASRLVPRLFYANENLYGSFSIYQSTKAPGEPRDGYIYLLSTSNNGIKMLRVGSGLQLHREYYRYWNGSAFVGEQPKVSDSSANLIKWSYLNPFNNVVYGPGAGDVFWSVYFRTYVIIFMGDSINAAFFISYSTSQRMTGPWTAPAEFYNPPGNKECDIYSPNYALNYAGHAYPAMDPTGKTLLLSYSSCNAWVSMATVTWK